MTDTHTESTEPDIETPPHRTLPQSSNRLSADSNETSGVPKLSRDEFIGLFRRDGANMSAKPKPKPKRKAMKGDFKCKDIRKFYSFKLQQPPTPVRPSKNNESKLESDARYPPGTNGNIDCLDILNN